jgi:hypothetical protein
MIYVYDHRLKLEMIVTPCSRAIAIEVIKNGQIIIAPYPVRHLIYETLFIHRPLSIW